jgi:chemotaxis protein methyltransferase WspC
MSVARFEDLLERTMGLDAASIGISAVKRALEVRMHAQALESQDAYWELLQRSRAELQQLIETVVVPETWFFRDPQAFTAMTAMAGTLLDSGIGRPLRLLSLPCSTGEEPYTIAMALLDAGLPSGAFRIDGIDISTRSLVRAQAGVFGRNSFRSRDLAFRDRHFEEVERGYRIHDEMRRLVNFHQGNMLDGDFLANVEAYDIVFCRNLLIYFDAPTQTRAIAVLKRLLTPQGMLFVGHSEAGLMSAAGLVSAKIPMAFAFLKAPRPNASAAPTTPTASPASPRPAFAPKPPVKLRRRPAPSLPRAPLSPPPPRSIDDLRRMADGGQFDEAARGAETHLRECGPSPEALLLLGLISDARGDAAAAQRHYRKVLYLEPANREALGHLALLLKKEGDHAGARLVDDRMRRRDEGSMP